MFELEKILDLIDKLSLGAIYILVIYHIIIAFGRKKEYRKNYILFSLIFFTFPTASICFEYMKTIDPLFYSYRIVSIITMSLFIISILLLMEFAIRYLKHKELIKKKYIYLYSILILLPYIFIKLLLPHYYKFSKIYIILGITILISYGLISSLIQVKTKKMKLGKRERIIKIAIVIFILYNVIVNILPRYKLFLIIEKFQGHHIIYLVMALLFSISLAIQFNEEHHELENMRKDLEERVNNKTDELKKANLRIKNTAKEKITFFIRIAHEMKTSITILWNYFNKILIEGRELIQFVDKAGIGLYESLREDFRITNDEMEKFKKRIMNIMIFNKMENKKNVFYHNKKINFSKFLISRVENLKILAKNKKIELNTYIEKKVYIIIDPEAAEYIINNLIDNAIKYTKEKGKINIFLNKRNECVELNIQDTGIGISDDQLKNIFLPYYQTKYTMERYKGIGMGLNIVKGIVDQIDGEIFVNSEKDRGSTFKIKFCNTPEINENDIEHIECFEKPIKEISKNIEFKKSDYLNNHKYSILIVEDNINLLLFLANELKKKYNIYTAINGKEALDNLKKIKEKLKKPDLIISDVMMDNMDGILFKETLLEDNFYNSVPFIFLTAKNLKEDKILGLEKGAIDYIEKPFDIKELKLKINSILKINKAQEINFFAKLNEVNKYNFRNFINKCKITQKEEEVIIELLNGNPNLEIAEILNITINTLQKHLKSIIEKIYNNYNKKMADSRELIAWINKKILH